MPVAGDRARHEVRKEAGGRTVHARSAAQALTAGHDGCTPAERSALPADLELDRRAVGTEMVEVSRGLDMKRVAAGRGTGLEDQDAKRRIGGGQTSGDDTTTGATYGRMKAVSSTYGSRSHGEMDVYLPPAMTMS